MAYSLVDNRIGTPDLSSVIVSGAIGTPGTTALPSAVLEAQLGEIRDGFDTTNGYGKFIFLKVPVSTTVTVGLLYQWDKNYTIAVVPVAGTSKNTAVPVAAAINTVSSNSSAVQYTWFQIQGQAVVLKTAVAAAPSVPVYISATAGRIKFVSSTGQAILGARTANTTTVTSTTSSVLVYLNQSSLPGA
jgi:hypothetical protein